MCCSTPSAGSWAQLPGASCSGGEHSPSPLKSPDNQTRGRELDREQRALSPGCLRRSGMSVEGVIKLRFDDLEQVVVEEALDQPLVASDVG